MKRRQEHNSRSLDVDRGEVPEGRPGLILKVIVRSDMMMEAWKVREEWVRDRRTWKGENHSSITSIKD